MIYFNPKASGVRFAGKRRRLLDASTWITIISLCGLGVYCVFDAIERYISG